MRKKSSCIPRSMAAISQLLARPETSGCGTFKTHKTLYGNRDMVTAEPINLPGALQNLIYRNPCSPFSTPKRPITGQTLRQMKRLFDFRPQIQAAYRYAYLPQADGSFTIKRTTRAADHLKKYALIPPAGEAAGILPLLKQR